MADFDVIVVGGGGSGLAAAARAAELGLSVIVLEKQPQLGGTTGIAVGSFTANRTRWQQRSGIVDSLEAHATDAGKFAKPEIEACNNEPLRRFFLSHTAETLNWLEQMGLLFHGPSPEPPNRVPRMHNVVPNAKAYIAALQSRVLEHNGQIVCGTAVISLIRQAGRVVGVQVEGQQEYRARLGVVLAAGDYANSSALIARFKGSEFSAVEGINPFAEGDGHRLAEEVGAQLLNMEVTYGPEFRFVPPVDSKYRFTQLLPSSGPWARFLGALLPFVPRFLIHAFIKRLLVTWQHPEDQLFTHGAILVNVNGQRFCEENQSPQRELAVARQPDKSAYILLDERLCNLFSCWPHFVSTAPEIAYAYVADYLKLRPDVAVAVSSLEELEQRRSLPTHSLTETVRQVNESRADGTQPKLEGNQWVLLGPLKSYFTTTEGGAAINQQFEVLDEQQAPIPGLYAIGQNGLGGQILWGHGLHIGWAITSGKLVAEHLHTLKSDVLPEK